MCTVCAVCGTDDPTPVGTLQREFCVPRRPPQMAKVRRVEADLAQRLVTSAWDAPSADGFDCGTNVRTTRVTVYRGSTSDVINTTVCSRKPFHPLAHLHATFVTKHTQTHARMHTYRQWTPT